MCGSYQPCIAHAWTNTNGQSLDRFKVQTAILECESRWGNGWGKDWIDFELKFVAGTQRAALLMAGVMTGTVTNLTTGFWSVGMTSVHCVCDRGRHIWWQWCSCISAKYKYSSAFTCYFCSDNFFFIFLDISLLISKWCLKLLSLLLILSIQFWFMSTWMTS